MSPQRESQKFQVGDKVHLKRCPEFRGEIVDGPILNGGDWVVQWEGLMECDEFVEDLVLIQPPPFSSPIPRK